MFSWPWPHGTITAMASTSDSELLAQAEASIAAAQEIMGLPAPEARVSGGTWDDIAERIKNLLKKAWSVRPTALGAKAGGKLREAARAGLESASSASQAARDLLQRLSLAAGLLAMSPGILLGLAAFLLIEHTGYGRRARAAGRRYVSRRAAQYGF